MANRYQSSIEQLIVLNNHEIHDSYYEFYINCYIH